MANKKEVKKEVAEEVIEEVAEEKYSKDSATVYWRGGERTYDKETHGKDFKKLADQFAKKFNGVVK